MKRINILFIFIFSVPSATFSQQSDLLEKYRSMAVEYNHDLNFSNKSLCWAKVADGTLKIKINSILIFFMSYIYFEGYIYHRRLSEKDILHYFFTLSF